MQRLQSKGPDGGLCWRLAWERGCPAEQAASFLAGGGRTYQAPENGHSPPANISPSVPQDPSTSPVRAKYEACLCPRGAQGPPCFALSPALPSRMQARRRRERAARGPCREREAGLNAPPLSGGALNGPQGWPAALPCPAQRWCTQRWCTFALTLQAWIWFSGEGHSSEGWEAVPGSGPSWALDWLRWRRGSGGASRHPLWMWLLQPNPRG